LCLQNDQIFYGASDTRAKELSFAAQSTDARCAGQNRTCADAAIADAEFPRSCSDDHLAVQHSSPKRRLKRACLNKFQTDLSRRSALTV
jgi:hypothetical protein